MVSEDPLDREDDEDVVTSSIFDLDHAPSPRQRQSSTSSSAALFAGRASSVSPHPPPGRKQRTVSDPSTAFRMRESLPRRLLRNSAPVRRTYGSQSSAQASDAGSLASKSTMAPPRRRAYSAAAAEIPTHHLSHVRSFPPLPASSEYRHADSIPTTIVEDSIIETWVTEDVGTTNMHTPPPPTLSVEETKEPCIDEEEEIENVFTEDSDLEYASPLPNVLPAKARTDSLLSDTAGSIFSLPEAPSSGGVPGEDSPHNFRPELLESNGEEYGGSAAITSNSQPIKLCFGCIQLPLWCSKRRISWNRVASFVAVWSPCFLCIRMKYNTYRSVLYRLNILCGCVAVVQLISSTWCFVILQNRSIVNRTVTMESDTELEYDSRFQVLTNVWNLNGSIWGLGILALIVLVAVTCTVRAIQNVDLVGAIRFFWIILWVVPLQLFWAISLFDYFRVTEVWIKFWWRDQTMAWFRAEFCNPPATANAECTVPVSNDPNKELEWCQSNFNNSDTCTATRDQAQVEVAQFLRFFYYGNAIWTIVFIALLFLVVKTLESMITRPLVEKSRELNMPLWLLLPMAGSFSCGFLYAFSPTSVLNTQSQSPSELSWIAPLFIVASGLFFLLALLAWFLRAFPILSTQHKQYKSLVTIAFIGASLLVGAALTVIFCSSIFFTLSLTRTPISETTRGLLACFIDRSGSCTLCDEADLSPAEQCPEWSRQDVTRILQSQSKAGATLAAICFLYAVGAFRYGCTMRRHIRGYCIEYV